MKTMQELRDDLNHKVRTLADLKEKVEKRGDAMTAEEKSTTEALVGDVDRVNAEIATLTDHEARMANIDKIVKTSKQPEQRATVAEQPGKTETRIEVPSYGLRYGQLRAFKGENADRNAYISGQWYRASILGNYSAQKWCNDNGISYRAQSEGTNTAGGALVPEVLTQAIIDLRETYGVFRRECDVMPMGSDTVQIPRRTGGLTATFVAENTAIGESDMTWNNVTLSAKKLGVVTRMSTELAEDAIINVADTIANEMAYAFALKEDQCGFLGDGTSTYGGIVGVTVKALQSAYSASLVTAPGTNHDTFGEIDATDIATLMSALPQYARANAKFYISQAGMDLVFGRLMAAGGGNTMQNLAGPYVPRYLGHEIVVSQVLPAGAATDYTALWMLGFGNLRQAATLGERRGVQIKRSEERYFLEDQIALKGTTRIDINVHDMGSTTAAGPFVSLVGS